MHASKDPRLALQTSIALVLANARYWTTVAPLTHRQLQHWKDRADQIPDPALKKIAQTAHRQESFNAQATATLATLAPTQHRAAVIQAIIALQVLYDYLDGLLEQPLTDPLTSGRQLYRALVDAVTLNTQPSTNYYRQTPWSNDGSYLSELVQAIQHALTPLPSRTAIVEVSQRAAERCSEAQVRAHATTLLGDAQLERWAQQEASDPAIDWREYMVAAVSSGLALHALITAAADLHVSYEQAAALDETYLPICAITTLLDGLVDYEQDLQDTGLPGYIRYYKTQSELLHALHHLIAQAKIRITHISHPAHHLMTLTGIVAYYSSSPTAAHPHSRTIIQQATQDFGPLISPTLTLMRLWRTAKR